MPTYGYLNCPSRDGFWGHSDNAIPVALELPNLYVFFSPGRKRISMRWGVRWKQRCCRSHCAHIHSLHVGAAPPRNWNGLARFAQQLQRFFVHANDRTIHIMRSLVNIKEVFHSCHKLSVMLGTTMAQFCYFLLCFAFPTLSSNWSKIFTRFTNVAQCFPAFIIWIQYGIFICSYDIISAFFLWLYHYSLRHKILVIGHNSVYREPVK